MLFYNLCSKTYYEVYSLHVDTMLLVYELSDSSSFNYELVSTKPNLEV